MEASKFTTQALDNLTANSLRPHLSSLTHSSIKTVGHQTITSLKIKVTRQ
jgi:hypothetical protein